MHQLACAQIWGGIRDEESEVCSAGVTASLFSGACTGGKGGDIYYVSVCSADQLTRIAVADVAGHGPDVSDVSQWLYDALAAHMSDLSCDGVLTELNRLASGHGIRALTTAAVLGFYTGDSNLYYAYAGHAPLLVSRRGSPGFRPAPLDPGAPNANAPLGVLPEADFDQQSQPLASGDRLFVYTDGLVEAPSPEGELFGEKRLVDTLDAAADAPLADLKRSVLDAARRHAGGGFDHDDVTLVAVEVR